LVRGQTTLATIADHVVPHRGDWNFFLTGALQSLCETHHNSTKRQFDLRGYDAAIGPDGYPLDPRHPVYALIDRTTNDNEQSIKVVTGLPPTVKAGGRTKKFEGAIGRGAPEGTNLK
jgi:hypothetical protein